MGLKLKTGDWVVFRKSKQGRAPGPRAQHVTAASKGEDYAYIVDKYWVVEDVLNDGSVLLRTRRGKLNRISADDPGLRKAGLLTRIWQRSRFQAVDSGSSDRHHPALSA